MGVPAPSSMSHITFTPDARTAVYLEVVERIRSLRSQRDRDALLSAAILDAAVIGQVGEGSKIAVWQRLKCKKLFRDLDQERFTRVWEDTADWAIALRERVS